MARSIRGLFLLSIMVIGCDSDSSSKGDSPLLQRCSMMCALPACDGVTELSPDTVEQCSMNCLDKNDAASDMSADCETTYLRSIECVSALECSSLKAWEQGDSEPCQDALQRFDDACGDLKFTFSG